ncbi:NAD(P)/FAD-dependent oxidoreductase [Alicyclobacillus curvatus]|nr:NAD(P)/FAD-dependent oxidoreductase [Alicyclobacillus curvatus]
MGVKDSNVLTDVVVVGGGPAGLNAALVLGRARRRVVIIDEEIPRNRVTHESHGFLTRDGISPQEFRRIAKEQISKYPSVSFESGIVSSVTGSYGGEFHVTTESGRMVRTGKVLFATGMKDVLPDIEGLTEVYGTSAFVCPFCDGWELRDKQICVIGTNEMVLHLVKLIRGWTNRITLLTNGSQFLTADHFADLERHNVATSQDTIKQIESSQGLVQRITLKTGAAIDCEGIFFTPKLVQANSIPASLGCEVSENGPFSTIVTDPMGRTNIPGVYSAGDASSSAHQLITAASSGAIAACIIQLDLLDEEWKSSH